MTRNWTVALAMTAALGACDRVGTEPAAGSRVSLSLVTASGAAAGPLADAAPRPAAAGGSGATLQVERVQLLLRDAELERQDDDACEGEDDACERFRSGATLVDLPLDSRVVTPFSSPVPPGTYDRLLLRVQEPDDRTGERAAFHAAHPAWPGDATLRVRGSVDEGSGARAFDVFLPVDLRVERELVPPLVVDDATRPGSINVTVAVDVQSWFRRGDGSVIDPAAAAGDEALRGIVEDNVRRSFRALRDDDRDGRDDHGGENESGDDHGNGGDDHGGDDHGGH